MWIKSGNVREGWREREEMLVGEGEIKGELEPGWGAQVLRESGRECSMSGKRKEGSE